jgi:hypothetical protein
MMNELMKSHTNAELTEAIQEGAERIAGNISRDDKDPILRAKLLNLYRAIADVAATMEG